MAPVMWALWRLVLSADRLHGWHYSENIPPPTDADKAFAALVFWAGALTPALIGLAAGVWAFRRELAPRWPVLEMAVAALPFAVLASGLMSERAIMIASLLAGGTVVSALMNLGACARHGDWRKGAASAAAVLGGMLYLLWLYAFIIYVDT